MIGNELDLLLARQKMFMRVLNIDPDGGTLLNEDVPSRDEIGAAIGVSTEAAEILELINKANRVWKTKEFNTATEMKEELIDVVFFILELAIFLGLTGEDLLKLYDHKYRKNLIRIYSVRIKNGDVIEPMLGAVLASHFTEEELELIRREIKEA
jgi:NTP pyrophosphatase (non-canonical NTP hydrolase)